MKKNSNTTRIDASTGWIDGWMDRWMDGQAKQAHSNTSLWGIIIVF